MHSHARQTHDSECTAPFHSLTPQSMLKELRLCAAASRREGKLRESYFKAGPSHIQKRSNIEAPAIP